MMQHLLHLLLSALSLLLTAYFVRGFEVKSFFAACIAAIVVGLANMLLWPLLIFLTLPINILTLGLFTFVVNGAVLKICAAVVPGFQINGWAAAIFGSIILAIVSAVLRYFFMR